MIKLTLKLISLSEWVIRLFGFVLGILIVAACDESFQPFQENDKYAFSIYGYLDASADTQWIRVAQARQEFDTPPAVPDIQVTLEHLESGEMMGMEDSLFKSEGDFYYLNFWTTMNIDPGKTYLVKAENQEVRESSVTVTIPEEFPTPVIRPGEKTHPLYIDGNVEHIADVQTRWYVLLKTSGFKKKKMFSFSYRNEIERKQIYGGIYGVTLKTEFEREQIIRQTLLPPDGEIEVLHRQVFIASGGPEWNEEIPLMDDPLYGLPDSFSNVEDGLGYVVGVVSKVIPYRSCVNEYYEFVACPEEEPYW